MKVKFFLAICLFSFLQSAAQHSVARRWNEVHLEAVREDRTRVPVQSRYFFHTSIAMYDCWALYDSLATPFLIGKTYAGNNYPIGSIAPVNNIDSAQRMAISYAVYRVLRHQFSISPNTNASLYRFDTLMQNLGYDISYTSMNYTNGTPADLGNWVASQIINMKFTDNSNESSYFSYQDYFPLNTPLDVSLSGNTNMVNVQHWQPLNIPGALDQGNNPIPSIQIFDSPEWGRVEPFALRPADRNVYSRFGSSWPVYFDPGVPPMLNEFNANDTLSELFKWGHTMVSVWSSHLDPDDTTTLDISPGAMGNIPLSYLPFAQQQSYYRFFQGGDTSTGYAVNPTTNLPYASNVVKRGDYTRVVSQYWADGPTSETPPGHWHLFLNKVMDSPGFQKKYQGTGPVLPDLEWDVKAYFTLGGAMHDAAISAWSIKGWYDSPRPISALRVMAEYGQCTDTTLPNYHVAGLPLITNYIELIDSSDALAGANYENVNEIKLYTWYGFDSIQNPNDYAGVGWMLAKKWMPYQRPTFVSPPFAGYVSGHSTFSRAGAEVLTLLTGSSFFPGGLMEHTIMPSDSFLVFENGPSVPITLQWATYYDASNEASLSRIWGGIHPPFDDMYGRVAGEAIGQIAVQKAATYFDNSVLPVKLLSYNVIEKNCNAQIKWTTTKEKNIAQYEVWHSADGVQFDRLVAAVKPHQLANNEYTVRDIAAGRLNYYQIREKDINQKISVLATCQKLKITCDNIPTAISVYPNPTSSQLNIRINNGENLDRVALYNLVGTAVIQKTLSITTESTSLDLTNITDGVYILKLKSENGQEWSQKVLRIK